MHDSKLVLSRVARFVRERLTPALERPLREPVSLSGRRLSLRPFQIVTLRFGRG